MGRNGGPLVSLAIWGMVSGVAVGELISLPTELSNGEPRLGKTQFLDVNSAIAERQRANKIGQLAANTESKQGSARSMALGAESMNLQLVSRQASQASSKTAESVTNAITKTTQKESVPKTQKRRVLVFKATWCGACQGLNYEWPKLEAVQWKVGDSDTNHIQLVDADARPDLLAKYGVSSLPTLLLVEDDKEIARHGLLTARSIAELYYGRL